MTLSRYTAATSILEKLIDGSLKPSTLMEETLHRIEKINPTVNAIVALRDTKNLMDEAFCLDNVDYSGPLHGLPIAVKDLVNVAGIRSTQGSSILSDFVPEQDDLLASRLRSAGAIIIGKTNTPEFGLGSHTFNSVYGVTRNPYNLSLSCGGSSGGAAVALATGMLSLADGSDMMGSLRNPAGWNNVYGFRPSWGMIPDGPKEETFLHQLSTLGPMARHPQDILLLLNVMMGCDRYQPHYTRETPLISLTGQSIEGLRFAWLRDWDGAFQIEDGILETCEAALRIFEEMGAVIETPKPPFDAETMFQSWSTLRSWQISTSLSNVIQREGALKDSVIWELRHGKKLSAFDVHAASCVRSHWFRVVEDMFDQFAGIFLPTAQVWPFPNEVAYPREINGVLMDTYHRWMQVMVPASLVGLPALAMPAGFGKNDLPIGLQLIGRRWSDSQLLSIGASYDKLTDWCYKGVSNLRCFFDD
ncbi:MAG: amidase [Aestuariivita sp.]|nr:amidase [Aestuariivita sp.]